MMNDYFLFTLLDCEIIIIERYKDILFGYVWNNHKLHGLSEIILQFRVLVEAASQTHISSTWGEGVGRNGLFPWLIISCNEKL